MATAADALSAAALVGLEGVETASDTDTATAGSVATGNRSPLSFNPNAAASLDETPPYSFAEQPSPL